MDFSEFFDSLLKQADSKSEFNKFSDDEFREIISKTPEVIYLPYSPREE